MFVLRNEDYEFIGLISGSTIETTKELKDAILFEKLEAAKTLKSYINIENPYLELDIIEIQFKEVEDV